MKLVKYIFLKIKLIWLLVSISFTILISIGSLLLYQQWQKQEASLVSDYQLLVNQKNTIENDLISLKSEDQRVINNRLQKDIKQINSSFIKASSVYEDLIDLRDTGVKTSKIEPFFSPILVDLAKMDYNQAILKIATFSAKITEEKQKNLPIIGGLNPTNITENNTPPNSGFSRQKVKVGDQYFIVDIIAADLNNIKVIVDTASDNNCVDNCPVLPLSSYISRNGAIAGINGSYFCPASYPSCSSKKNSFDTLLMNKNKIYFNSDNNVYSTVPAVIFSGNSARFVNQSLEWGRDTGVDAVLANYPLLVKDKNLITGNISDIKLSANGNRAFIGNKGNLVYIGVVRGVSVAGAAKVLAEMGLDNALNLDSGGSTALWYGGAYKYGPGRDIPNAILFVKK
jgi:exopolysaccharide biosynthesis protein